MSNETGYLSNRNSTQRKKKEAMSERLKKHRVGMLNQPYPPTYLITEIPYRDYTFCKRRLGEVINKEQKEYKSADDVFMKSIIMAKTRGGEKSWNEFEKDRKTVYALSQSLGDFHEELAGKIPGYRTLPLGHWSGLDVIKEDRTELYEFKNKPIDGDKFYEVFQKFQKIIDNSEKINGLLVLVFVNVPDGWRRPPLIAKKRGMPQIDLTRYEKNVKIVSGKDAYAHMT